MRIKFISDSQEKQTVLGSSFDDLLVITKEENSIGGGMGRGRRGNRKRSLEEKAAGQTGDRANFCLVLKSSLSTISI